MEKLTPPPADSLKPRKSKLPPGRFYKAQGGEGPEADLGYVNAHGILFPVGYKFNGGHISSFDVVLVACPKCKKRPLAVESVKGICPENECRYSALDELDAIDSI